jgi:hypothetical protein
MGEHMNEEKVKHLLTHHDKDKNGVLEFDEFTSFALEYVEQKAKAAVCSVEVSSSAISNWQLCRMQEMTIRSLRMTAWHLITSTTP